MREIKFRVWDVLNKRMLDWGDIFDLPAWEIFPGTPEQRTFEVMQYTGLRDKNGREVYEGDIVKLIDVDKSETIGEVVFNDCNASFCIKERDEEGNEFECWGFLQLSIFKVKVEVIGNIYENPELLENIK